MSFVPGKLNGGKKHQQFFRECVDTASMIGKVMFRHCFRFANQAAHVLANYSFCNKTSYVWLDEPPDSIVSALVNDVTLFEF